MFEVVVGVGRQSNCDSRKRRELIARLVNLALLFLLTLSFAIPVPVFLANDLFSYQC